jgi:hypothetical protein
MRFNHGLTAFPLAAAWCLCTGSFLRAADFVSEVDNDWFRAWPPASVTYSFPSTIRQSSNRLGDINTLAETCPCPATRLELAGKDSALAKPNCQSEERDGSFPRCLA